MTPKAADRMTKRDSNDLRTAVNLLEKPGLGIRLINLLGYPIEGIIKVPAEVD